MQLRRNRLMLAGVCSLYARIRNRGRLVGLGSLLARNRNRGILVREFVVLSPVVDSIIDLVYCVVNNSTIMPLAGVVLLRCKPFLFAVSKWCRASESLWSKTMFNSQRQFSCILPFLRCTTLSLHKPHRPEESWRCKTIVSKPPRERTVPLPSPIPSKDRHSDEQTCVTTSSDRRT